MIVSYPINIEEANAVKAVLKALKVRFEIKKDEVVTAPDSSKKEIINNLKKGFEEMKLIKKGKLKTTSLTDFLNEL